ncbi:MAG TPA: hypothetical protein VHS59_12915, partial [Bacillota bacterium]|nr:hypothetical protein [Bacillota bacterium]
MRTNTKPILAVIITLVLLKLLIRLAYASPAEAASGLIILSHNDNAVVSATSVLLSGTVSTSYSTEVSVNGESAPVNSQGGWSQLVDLESGTNTITVQAYGSSGTISKVIHIISTDGAPYINITNPTSSTVTVSTYSYTT